MSDAEQDSEKQLYKTLSEIQPESGFEYIPGDENGMLAVNPDTIVEDMRAAYIDFWSQYDNGDETDLAELEARGAERNAAWLAVSNGRVRNAFQLENNIYRAFNEQLQLTAAEMRALAVHPNPEIRGMLAGSHILDPVLFSKIFELSGRNPLVFSLLSSDQSRLLRERGLEKSRFGITYDVAMSRIKSGDYGECLTAEERRAATPKEVITAHDKSRNIPYDLLYPHRDDPRFEGILGVSVYLVEDVETTTSPAGIEVIPSATYRYSNEIAKYYSEEAVQAAQQEAARQVGNRVTTEYFERLLQLLHNDPSINLVHIISGVNRATGEQFHAYGQSR